MPTTTWMLPFLGCFTWEPTVHVTNAINSKSSLYLRSRRQLHTAGHYPLAGSVQHFSRAAGTKAKGEKAKANVLSLVLFPPPPSSVWDWGQFAADCPRDSEAWAPAGRGRTWWAIFSF